MKNKYYSPDWETYESRKKWYSEMLKRPEWYEKRKQVLKRDYFYCKKCGSNKNLEVHHKEYKGDIYPFDYKIDDLITLCNNCHKKQHNLNIGTKTISERINEAHLANPSKVIEPKEVFKKIKHKDKIKNSKIFNNLK
jgi:5-methylcytosine-specific restriction endonuclease McrA